MEVSTARVETIAAETVEVRVLFTAKSFKRLS
jgi:hypothetical protein